ncbi:MAG: protein kinase [Candidatus Aminicenantes bacterium]|nr:protein kinase [Candidatus Aminicenantes bacterium]
MTILCPKCQHENPEGTSFCGKCGTKLGPDAGPTLTAETPKQELTTGSTFAHRYQIIEELGKGGMGKVYKVYDTKINEKIALKLIKPEIASDKKTIQRFSNELKFARKIRHKNICQMFDLGEYRGTHFITMEYVEGQDLKRMIRQSGQLSLSTILHIIKQVCDGLAEAHSSGIVHRDLKPNNIMIDADGNVRIMDFGIARSLITKGITGTGMMVGTPEYMSPEQTEAKEMDERSDIYSLGVILFEMTTGHLPFKGETPLSIAMKHKGELPRNPKDLNTQIPDKLSDLILKCLEQDKKKRYQSAEEVHFELKKIEQGIPTADRVKPKKKPLTSKEITVTFGLKKLLIPSAAFVLFIIAAIVLWNLRSSKELIRPPSGSPSVAVLPFEDLSSQKDQEHFCNGLAESLINALTHIQDLRIPARTSSFSFKDKVKNLREIGKRLNVNNILQGSVQKSGNKIRITVQLIDVIDESLIWSEQYNRELDDVFVIQDDIALAIVDKLKINLLGEERVKLLKRYTENAEAYELYLQGRYLWDKRTHEAMNKGIDFFERAIEIDPDFALAYAGISDCFASIGWYSLIPKEIAYKKAKETAEKAIQIDNTLSEAYVSLGNVKALFGWDWEGAEESYLRALSLNPSNAEAHHQYAHLLTMRGKVEKGVSEMKQALVLEPLSPVINSCLGQNLYFARKYDAAINQLKKAMEMDLFSEDSYEWIGKSYLQKGLIEQSQDWFEKGMTAPRFKTRMLAVLGYSYALEGKKTDAQNTLNQLRQISENQYVDPCYIAWIYAGLGEKEFTFKWLNKGLEERSNWMIFLKTDPCFDSLRKEHEFKALLKKMNLE